MVELYMSGPFKFDSKTIEEKVQEGKIGNYALGTANHDGTMKNVAYIGRSDNNLKAELLARLKTHKHPNFKVSYASSPKEAYTKECQNYHDFDPPQNNIHPYAPVNSNLKCHICGE